MDAALTKVLQERDRIRARIGEQRAVVQASFAGLAVPLAIVDRAVGIGRYLRSHPVVVGIMVASVVAMRARSVWGALGSGIGAWRAVGHLRALARGFDLRALARGFDLRALARRFDLRALARRFDLRALARKFDQRASAQPRDQRASARRRGM